MSPRYLRLCCCGLLAGAVALEGCGSSAPAGPNAGAAKSDPAAPALQADLLIVEPVTWPRTARSQGALVADEVAVVGAKVAGRIGEVHVDLGDQVHAGDTLVVLDREELKLQAAQAEAQLRQARAAVGLDPEAPLESLNVLNSPPVREAQAILEEAISKSERLQALRLKNALTETELQQVLAAEKVAKAQYSSALNAVNEKVALIYVRVADLALARERLAEAVTVAPFDGIVQQRHVAPGSFVQVGQAVATIVRTNPLRFRGMLPERYAHELRPGLEVRLRIESIPGGRIANVTRISPALNEQSRALMFEADVDNSDGRLRAGLFAEADVVLDPQRQTLALPEAAITEFAGAEKVWKVVNGKSVEQVIQTGGRQEGFVEIAEGLASGDLVLSEANQGRSAMVQARSRRPTPGLPSQLASPVTVARPTPSAQKNEQDDEAQGSEHSESATGSVPAGP